jgi:hypothetical protein
LLLQRSERIPIAWRLGPDGLEFMVHEHWHGPFRIHLKRRQLPLGAFTSLISDTALLSFGLREFQQLSTIPAI